MIIKIISLKIDIMDTYKEKKAIQERLHNATDDELLVNIRVAKILSFLFSRNFFRGFLFIFMMLINLYFFNKTDNTVRLLINTIAGVFLTFFITEYINTDENAAIEKYTVEILRKMRKELKEKQTI